MFFRKANNAAEIGAVEVYNRLQKGEELHIVDVRQPGEYASGHVAGSQLIPLGQLGQRLNELPKDRPLVAICRSGSRSQAATSMLKSAGYDIVNLQGGMIAWERARLPVER